MMKIFRLFKLKSSIGVGALYKAKAKHLIEERVCKYSEVHCNQNVLN